LVGKELHISVAEEETGKYIFKMTNAIGQIIIYEEIDHKSKTPFESLALPANLPRGIYQLQIISPSEKRNYVKIIK
jgi:hypothetical protein